MRAKQVLREQRRQARRAREHVPLDPLRCGPISEVSAIAGYVPLPTEPDPAPLLESASTVLLPRVVDDTTLAWVERTPTTTFQSGAFGIDQPDGPDASKRLTTVDVILIPALAVDTAGHRLGQGGGYYDRALAELPRHTDGGPLRVAVVYDEEILREVPTQTHDALVDAIVTPTRFLMCRPDPV